MLSALSTQLNKLRSRSDTLLATFVILILTLLVIPVYPFIIDLLIALSITFAVMTLLVTLYAKEPLSFSAFPSLLLFLTLYRLGLNIATTRMILNNGYAGKMVQTFGDFVTGGNLVVGFIIFLLLTGINFVVITKGSGRVAEVAARFTLDALPGKQMSIDADLNTGVIDKKEALARRKKVIAESDFYGAMDGASKFVRGDAIAGIVITLINVAGGFIIGTVIKGLPFHDVAHIYLTLTVGDGLVTQIPALLISVASGIIVTRSSSDENLGTLFANQLFGNPKALMTTSCVLIILGLVPGMPTFILIVVASILFLVARGLQLVEVEPEKKEREEHPNRLSRHFQEEFDIHIGAQLNIELLTSLAEQVRKEMIQYLGIPIPPIDIYIDHSLLENNYQFFLKGSEISSYNLYPDMLFVVPLKEENHKIEGIPTIEPNTDSIAFWVKRDAKSRFSSAAYEIYEPSEVFIKHLKGTLQIYADEILNRRDVLKLIEQAKTTNPEIVEEIFPHRINLTNLTRILRTLLHEGIPLAKFTSILDTLADNIYNTTDVETLVEYVRQSMVRQLVLPYVSMNKNLYVIVLDPKVDQMFTESISSTSYGKKVVVHPTILRNLIYQLSTFLEKGKQIGCKPVLMTSIKLRPHIKKMIEKYLPKLPVFSYQEISPYITVKQIGIISADVLSYLPNPSPKPTLNLTENYGMERSSTQES